MRKFLFNIIIQQSRFLQRHNHCSALLFCPLFPGKPLRRGRSSVNRINWINIDLATRQFFRILVTEGFIDPNNRVEMRKVINLLCKVVRELQVLLPPTWS